MYPYIGNFTLGEKRKKERESNNFYTAFEKEKKRLNLTNIYIFYVRSPISPQLVSWVYLPAGLIKQILKFSFVVNYSLLA